MHTAEVHAHPLAVLQAASRNAHLSGGFGPQYEGQRGIGVRNLLTFNTCVMQIEVFDDGGCY
jgi:hypothetical protein